MANGLSIHRADVDRGPAGSWGQLTVKSAYMPDW